MSGPDISAVVPTFRRSESLPRLVAAFEKQTLAPERFELLIVDNGSNDQTSKVIEELAAASPLQIRPLVVKDNKGPAGARNLGWKNARAPIVAFTDDDCVPDPEWLHWGLTCITLNPDVGVVQGCTLKPLGHYDYSRWTTFREVLTPSPWFEGCNLFFRREVLEKTGGFDESIYFGGEDTVAGWSVLAEGWKREFERAAVVRHDLGERGVRWHMKMGYREGESLGIANRFPDLQRHGFWRPWALRPLNVAFAAGVVGTLLALWRKPSLLLWLPWFLMRRPPRGTPHYWRYVGEKWAVDASVFVGMKVAAVKHRRFSL